MGNTPRGFGSVLSVTVILLLAGVPAGADLLYNTFGPDDGTMGSWGYTIRSWSTAVPFSFAGPQSYYLDRLEVAISLVYGPNTLSWALRSDAADLPGATLESFEVTDAMGAIGASNPPVEISSVARPLLTPGTPYWLHISVPSDTEARWIFASPTVSGNFVMNYEGSWFVFEDDLLPAFRIHGEPVPLPGAALLGILGLGSAGWRLRRRRA